MQAWIAETHSHEDGPPAVEGKHVILRASKEEVFALADFMSAVAEYLKNHEYCHMHLRDYLKSWDGAQQVDIEVNVRDGE